jgi:hypothetical protein
MSCVGDGPASIWTNIWVYRLEIHVVTAHICVVISASHYCCGLRRCIYPMEAPLMLMVLRSLMPLS